MMTYLERHNRLPDSGHRLQTLVQSHLGEVFPAAALVILRDGDCLFDGVWGAEGHAVHPDMLFDLASVSKLFTTTAFLSLLSEHKVALDDPVVSVIPEFGAGGARGMDGGQDPHTRVMLPVPPEAQGATVDPTRITFRQLLTHTSGLAPWRAIFQVAGDIPPPPDQTDPFPIAQRRLNALRAICASPFVGQPDGTIRYSDLGLILIGETVARLQGEPLEDGVRRRVTEPLGLASVGYNPLQRGVERARIAPTEVDHLWRMRRCWGEVHDENACGLGGIAGHAGLFAHARDVAAFGQSWLELDARMGVRADVLREATCEQAASGDERRGIGWMLKARANASVGERFSADSYGHTGFTGTSLWIDPARGLVVACLTNRVYVGREKVGIMPFRRQLHDLVVETVEA